MVRRPSVAFVLLTAGSLAACFAGPGDDATASNEDELRFRATSVDTTLPEVDAVGYAIDLTITDDPGNETFRATVEGTYVATEDLSELSLDFEGNTIDDVTVGGLHAEHRREGSRLVVSLPQNIASGKSFTTRITYRGELLQADGTNPNDFNAFGGFMVKQRNTEGRRIYTSLSWPSKARRWLPLRDHPRDVAQVAFTATWPASFTVLANGKRMGTRDNTDGSKTWRYEALTPMPTYDFHVSAYEGWSVGEARSTSNVPIATYAYARNESRVQQVYGDLPKALDFYERVYGKYRWGSAAFIEEPIFGGGMEHASVVSMDETLFFDPTQARYTAFHELAHHWSGNLVHFRTWNDFWLSEGFTEYLTARAIADVDGPDAGKRVYREYLSRTLAADSSTPHPLAPAEDEAGGEIDVLSIFDAIPYQKGALTVRMLEHIVGEPVMTAFLKRWFDRHGFGAAVTTDQLEHELEDASGKDLSGFFATFVRGSHHPELRVTFTPAGGETELRVEQVQGQGPTGGFLFPLELDLIDEAGTKERITIDLTAKTTTKRVATSTPVKSIVVDPDEHAIAVTVCGEATSSECKPDFRCAPQRGDLSVCVPR